MATDSTPTDSCGDSEVPAYIANRPRLDEPWGAGIISPYGDDEPPGPTEERREEMRRGWAELIAEYEAEFGAFTEEERAWADSQLNHGPG